MKAKIMFFLLLGFVTSTFCAFAYTNSKVPDSTPNNGLLDVPQQARVYVQADQIYVNEGGLFVEIESNFFQVAQISQDEKGFYVPHVDFWVKCAKGHPNPPWRATCQVCGLPL